MGEDLRVRKTKKALAEAFIALLQERHFEEITVNELCDRAEIRRATFYKHYTDKFHFLACFARSLRDKFDASFWEQDKPESTVEYYVEYVHRAIAFLNQHEALMNNVLKSDLFPTILNIITEQNYHDTRDRLEKSVAAGMKLSAPVETVAAMLTGGVATCLYIWLLDNKRKDPSDLAEEIGSLIRSTING